MQETAKCRRKRARVQAGGADTVIAQYFSGAAMQKDGGKRRFKRRHALRDQRANQAAEHIAAAASPAWPVGLTARCPSGAAITVPDPFRTTIPLYCAASARAAARRSCWTALASQRS